MPRADWDFLKKLEIIVPEKSLLKTFQDTFDNTYNLIVTLVTANDQLKKSRDLLLSRLISGKLPVDDLEIRFPPSMTEVEEPIHA